MNYVLLWRFVGVVATLALLLSVACVQKVEKKAESDQPGDSSYAPADTDSLVIELTGKDSLTVFELLKTSHEVDYLSSLQGVFVRAIDSVAGADGFFWIYSVNDSAPDVACDRYVTKTGDVVRWHYRRATE